ncbi:hypothetical protein V7S43_015993 [Phytophthora oleae]|uniref:Uncharacterized protein n=1 Tax=Phytophthora oleae TaxID=2107226 RepID=A0ABD3F0X7_9STRA
MWLDDDEAAANLENYGENFQSISDSGPRISVDIDDFGELVKESVIKALRKGGRGRSVYSLSELGFDEEERLLKEMRLDVDFIVVKDASVPGTVGWILRKTQKRRNAADQLYDISLEAFDS